MNGNTKALVHCGRHSEHDTTTSFCVDKKTIEFEEGEGGAEVENVTSAPPTLLSVTTNLSG